MLFIIHSTHYKTDTSKHAFIWLFHGWKLNPQLPAQNQKTLHSRETIGNFFAPLSITAHQWLIIIGYLRK